MSAAGVTFPYWEDRFGWQAVSVRTDRLDGRSLTTVTYVRGRQWIAYTIASGSSLPVGTRARPIVRGGTVLRSLSVRERRVVTWLRVGHTCVLSGSGVSTDALLQLGSWRDGGAIPY